MWKRSAVTSLAVILLIFGPNFAAHSFEQTSIFGPMYGRGTGKPQKVINTFSAHNTNQQFTLSVKNGEGKNRVSSAVIELNGIQVVGPNDFNKQVDLITKSVNLKQQNEIAVEVRSGPGTFITVTIVGAGGGSLPPSNLPPDPGENGKLTLEGIDSDADGVRDDVQRYIVLTYPDSIETQRALRQHTKALQAFILQAYNKDQALNNATKVNRAIECIFAVSHNDNDAVKISRNLRSVLVNTEMRTRAYLAADKQLSGSTFPIVNIEDRIKSCILE